VSKQTLSPEQEAIGQRLFEADQRFRDARINAYRRHREMARKEIHDYEVARAVIAAEAFAAGIKKTTMADRFLSTTNAGTAREAIELGRSLGELAVTVADIEDVATLGKQLGVTEKVERFELVDGRVNVTFTGAEFERYGIESDKDVWSFTVAADGTVTPEYADQDETWEHPVVRVVMAPGSDQWRQRIAEFVAAETK